MGVIPERIIFVGQDLFQVRPGDLGLTGNDRIGGKVAQTLGARAEETGDAADEVTQRKTVDKPQEITTPKQYSS